MSYKQADAQIQAALGFAPTPKPPKFPMKFRVFLRRAFGGRLHCDRLHLYRKYLLQQFEVEVWFRGGLMRVQNPQQRQQRTLAAEKLRDEFLEKMSRDGVTDPEWFSAVFQEIQRWRQLNRVQQRKDANQSRRLKENRKKILRLLQNRISELSQAEKYRFAKPKAKKVTGSHRRK